MRLLIVEDDPTIGPNLKSELEAESFAVDLAKDGERGSYLARINDYDVIILDLMLPLKDGCQICKDIRSNGKSTPIIMLTVESETVQKIRLFNCGADDYMTKPYSFSELLARIQAVLRRPPHLASELIEVGDLHLDITTQKVTRGGKDVYLTRKEFSLLEYLMKHKGSVVSRGMITEHVWDAENDPFSNTIEAHILNIRKKIDAEYKKKLIHTIPGRGYKIDIAK